MLYAAGAHRFWYGQSPRWFSSMFRSPTINVLSLELHTLIYRKWDDSNFSHQSILLLLIFNYTQNAGVVLHFYHMLVSRKVVFPVLSFVVILCGSGWGCITWGGLLVPNSEKEWFLMSTRVKDQRPNLLRHHRAPSYYPICSHIIVELKFFIKQVVPALLKKLKVFVPSRMTPCQALTMYVFTWTIPLCGLTQKLSLIIIKDF